MQPKVPAHGARSCTNIQETTGPIFLLLNRNIQNSVHFQPDHMTVYFEVSATESKVNSSSRCHWIVALGGWYTLLGSKACWTKRMLTHPIFTCTMTIFLGYSSLCIRYSNYFLSDLFITFFNEKHVFQRQKPLQEHKGGGSGMRGFHVSCLFIWKDGSPSSKGFITITPKMCVASRPWKNKP